MAAGTLTGQQDRTHLCAENTHTRRYALPTGTNRTLQQKLGHRLNYTESCATPSPGQVLTRSLPSPSNRTRSRPYADTAPNGLLSETEDHGHSRRKH